MCLVVKNLPANAGDAGSISGLERSPGGGNDNPLQYSCLEKSMDRGAWWGCKESDTTAQLTLFTFTEDLKQAGHSLQAGLHCWAEDQEWDAITLWGHR